MLSDRLQGILNAIPQADTVADIGTDHGYISVGLIQTGKAKRVIASDISLPSLQKAQTYVQENRLEEYVSCRLGNGIEVLERDEVDAVVIAGMGGVLISNILAASYESIFIEKSPYLILQPVQQVKEIRYYLYEQKFTIEKEQILSENGKVYHIIVAKKGEKIPLEYRNLSRHKDIYMEYGILNLREKSTLLKNIMQDKIQKKTHLLQDLRNKNVQGDAIKDFQEEVMALKEVYFETFPNG